MKIYFENLALSELKRLANTDLITGAEQFGFREKKNTSACILKMLDKWISRHEIAAKKYSKNRRYFMLFIDWKSAFDRVDHDLLMRRLEQIGASQRTLRIVHIFLYSSNFSVDGQERHRIERGCPQGSSLSPLLFIIFFGTLIDRLRSIISREKIGVFADDLVVQADGTDELETLIEAIRTWATENRCEINTSKTKIVEIRKQMINYPEGQKIQDYEIVSDYKYLGVPIDCSLTMSTYLEGLKKKINRLTGFAYKFQLKECSIATKLQLFKTYIKPHVDYAIEIWQLEKLSTKFERGVWPLFFKSLKQLVGIAETASNYRTLAALGLWHPKYVSMLQFVKSAVKLMKQYDSRADFEENMP